MDLTERESICRKIVQLHLVWKERNNFWPGRYAITLVQFHLLAEIRAEPGVSAVELANRLMIPKSVVSRSLASLERKRRVREELSNQDKRVKLLFITEEGLAALDEPDAATEAFFSACLPNLDEEELCQFEVYFKLLADGTAAPYAATAPTDSKLRVQVRRVTRSSGLLTSNLYGGATFNGLEWMLLYTAVRSRTPIIAAEFRQKYNVRANTLSDSLARLKKRKFIEPAPQVESDRRRIPLLPTELGRQMVDRHLELASQSMVRATLNFTGPQLKHYLYLLHKFLHGTELVEQVEGTFRKVLVKEVSVRRISTQEELQVARSFYIRRLVHNHESHLVSERIFSADSFCTILEKGEQTLAVLELVSDSEFTTVTNFSMADGLSDSSLLRSFIQTSIELLKAAEPQASVQFDERFSFSQYLL